MIICMSCYLLALLWAVLLAAKKRRWVFHIGAVGRLGKRQATQDQTRLSLASVLAIALLFMLCNMIATWVSLSPGGDRQNYIMDYRGVRPSSSAGLMFVIEILRKISADPNTLFFVTTFLVVAITMEAYRVSRYATPEALLLLLTTQYVLFSFTVIKQCYANAFATLCLILVLEGSGRKNTLLCILLTALAIWFHPAGAFLIPLFILIRVRKTKGRIIVFFLLFLLSLLLFEPLLLSAAALIYPILPSVANKIYEYFGEAAIDALQNSGVLTVFKGFPYFLIFIVGWVKRRALLDKISNYDNYLLLSGVLSFAYLFSIYNVWISRLAYFLLFPVAIFYVQLVKHFKSRTNVICMNIAVFGSNLFFTLRFIAMIFLRYGGF